MSVERRPSTRPNARRGATTRVAAAGPPRTHRCCSTPRWARFDRRASRQQRSNRSQPTPPSRPATIYKTYGGKPGLVRALCERALGGVGPVPAEQRSDALQAGETDPRKVIEGWGRLTTEVAPRIAPLLLLLRDAADGDPAASHAVRRPRRHPAHQDAAQRPLLGQWWAHPTGDPSRRSDRRPVDVQLARALRLLRPPPPSGAFAATATSSSKPSRTRCCECAGLASSVEVDHILRDSSRRQAYRCRRRRATLPAGGRRWRGHAAGTLMGRRDGRTTRGRGSSSTPKTPDRWLRCAPTEERTPDDPERSHARDGVTSTPC